MTYHDKLQEKGFKPKFKVGDTVQTKSHVKYYRKWKILEVGNILYIVDNDINGVIYFEHEDDWEKIE